jgi:hypothetical protein
METYMKVFGKMIKLMALECSLTLTMLDMKVNGLKIFNMVMVSKHGIMVLQNIQVNSIKERRVVKEDLNGKMEVTMKEILWMDNFKDLGNIISQT